MSGYSDRELHDVQLRWKIRFPPDLFAIYQRRRSVILHDDFDWLKTPSVEIQRRLEWPLTGMLFDVHNSGFWLEQWGEKPKRKAEIEWVVRAALNAAPKLIPVYGHRYIPDTPHQAGNPIFSVHQTDIIYYGANLDDYFIREGNFDSETWPKIRRIPFWSELADGGGDNE